MKKNILVKLAYDGSNYAGWQRQKDVKTIEVIVEEVCKNIFGDDTYIIGASRTDKGVHAMCQIFTMEIDVLGYDIENIHKVITRKLPRDIVAYESYEVPFGFHPRYDVECDKTYEYKILNYYYKIPQYRNYTGYVKKPLDVGRMVEASEYFIGEHDFKSFCVSKSSDKDTIRRIKEFEIIKKDNIIVIRIKGNGFLHNMVRIIVGTLIKIGEGKLEPKDAKKILLSKDRVAAGPTAPAEGLTLVDITYTKGEI